MMAGFMQTRREQAAQILALRMLGRDVRIELDGSPGARVLEQELALYPAASPASEPELRFKWGTILHEDGRRANPRIHEEFSDGFLAHFTTADVRFRVDDGRLRRVELTIPPSHRLISTLRKALDMQFASREERAGMVFHELALVPAAHWLSDVAVVHASAMAGPSGEVTLIGGTGGVGKTSLMLDLCLRRGFTFMADDISIVGADGWVHPNLAYPKIYAYNLQDNPELARRVFQGRRFADRVHWGLHRRRGLQFVRRRLAPDKLFGAYSATGGRLSRYFVLVREDRPNIDITELGAAQAAAVSVEVMPSEYAHFYNHLHWHAYHRRLDGKEPTITPQDVHARWRRLLGAVFQGVRCYMVRVPLNIEHHRFKVEMVERLAHTAEAG